MNVYCSSWFLTASLLFFAVYVIYKKNYSFSRVVFLFSFFYQIKIANKHYSKINDTGFESLPCQIFLRFIINIFRYPKLMTHWRVPLRNFLALWDKKNLDGKSWYSLLLIHKLFRYRKFSETQHRRVPLRIFSALWDQKFSTENWDTPFLLPLSSYP